ncbi:MAG: hypothetical protein ACRYG8_38720 [Janthinobacterium lividum]
MPPSAGAQRRIDPGAALGGIPADGHRRSDRDRQCCHTIVSISSITRLIGVGLLVGTAAIAHEDAEFVGWSSFGVGDGMTRPSPLQTITAAHTRAA